MAKTVAERLRKLKKSREDAGLVRVDVWVPDGKQNDLKAYAEKLRNEHFATLLEKDR